MSKMNTFLVLFANFLFPSGLHGAPDYSLVDYINLNDGVVCDNDNLWNFVDYKSVGVPPLRDSKGLQASEGSCISLPIKASTDETSLLINVFIEVSSEDSGIDVLLFKDGETSPYKTYIYKLSATNGKGWYSLRVPMGRTKSNINLIGHSKNNELVLIDSVRYTSLNKVKFDNSLQTTLLPIKTLNGATDNIYNSLGKNIPIIKNDKKQKANGQKEERYIFTNEIDDYTGNVNHDMNKEDYNVRSEKTVDRRTANEREGSYQYSDRFNMRRNVKDKREWMNMDNDIETNNDIKNENNVDSSTRDDNNSNGGEYVIMGNHGNEDNGDSGNGNVDSGAGSNGGEANDGNRNNGDEDNGDGGNGGGNGDNENGNNGDEGNGNGNNGNGDNGDGNNGDGDNGDGDNGDGDNGDGDNGDGDNGDGDNGDGDNGDDDNGDDDNGDGDNGDGDNGNGDNGDGDNGDGDNGGGDNGDGDNEDGDNGDGDNGDGDNGDGDNGDGDNGDGDNGDGDNGDGDNGDGDNGDGDNGDGDNGDGDNGDGDNGDGDNGDGDNGDGDNGDGDNGDGNNGDGDNGDGDNGDGDNGDGDNGDGDNGDGDNGDGGNGDGENGDGDNGDGDNGDGNNGENEEDNGFWNVYTITLVSVGGAIVLALLVSGAYYMGTLKSKPIVVLEDIEPPKTLHLPRVKDVYNTNSPSMLNNNLY